MDLERFAGVARCYGTQGLQKFSQARVAVVGVGGVGSWVAEAFARSGIGSINLIDLDDLCVSNTNRQLPALMGNYGLNKADALAERIRAINPACQVTATLDFVTPNNVEAHLSQCDLIVDACDALKSKVAMALHARRHKIPIWVSGAAGGQVDPTQIKTADLSKTIQDPLLAKMRRELRQAGWPKDGKKMGVACVYSTEQPRFPTPEGGVSAQRSQGSVAGLDCGGGLGAMMPVTAGFAMQLTAGALSVLSR